MMRLGSFLVSVIGLSSMGATFGTGVRPLGFEPERACSHAQGV